MADQVQPEQACSCTATSHRAAAQEATSCRSQAKQTHRSAELVPAQQAARAAQAVQHAAAVATAVGCRVGSQSAAGPPGDLQHRRPVPHQEGHRDACSGGTALADFSPMT